MSAPDRKTLAKLSAICSRLSSPFDGERSNAASLASVMLEGLGLTWAELIEAAFAEPDPVPTYAPTRKPRYYDPLGGLEITLDLLEELLEAGDTLKLNNWEKHFLETLIEKEVTVLSDKQRVSLSWILKKRDAAAAKAERAARAKAGGEACAA